MKSITIALLLLVFSIPGMAQQSRIVTDSVDSRILGQKCAYTLLLPESYHTDRQKTYPVLYLLHGLSDTNESWFRNSRLQQIADKLVANGEAEEMIIVSPKAGGNVAAGVWNGYFNMPGWPYEDFFFNEFIPCIESSYRITGRRSHRAIGGLSMGGGGSTVYAQRHPDMFCAVYAMSALMDLEENGGLPSNGQEKIEQLNRSVRRHSAVRFVREADEPTRKLLRAIEWMVDCGDDDFLFDCNIAFHQAMRDARITSQLRVRDGAHNWTYWNTCLYTALPFFSRAFGK